ncbi:MAG: iron-containing alcohol dehydrogenase [Promethearchaeota archaeon]
MWFFYSPDLIFGEDALDKLEQIDGKKCFIITDPGIIKVGLLEILTKKLDAFGKEYKVFSEVEPDPHEDTIYKARQLCADYEPDLIIGLGGGSSIDTSKAVWVLYERPDFATVDEIHPFQKLHTGKKSKLIAIPTTSGTGAETTSAVVITRIKDDGTHQKLEQINPEAIPTIAIVDPVFTKGLPKKLTAATGFDALGHCMEGFVSSWQNIFSDAFAVHAVRTIFDYLPRAVSDGSDMEARTKMHNAASMAGMSFGNSQVHVGHGMAHAMGAVLNIPHGNAVGVTVPFAMEFVINNPDKDETKNKYALMAKSLGVAEWSDDSGTAAKKLVARVRKLQDQTELPKTIADLGVSKEDFEAKVDKVVDQCLESGAVVLSPRSIRAEEFKKLLEHMYSGTPVDF